MATGNELVTFDMMKYMHDKNAESLVKYDVEYKPESFQFNDSGASVTNVTEYLLIEGNRYIIENKSTKYNTNVSSYLNGNAVHSFGIIPKAQKQEITVDVGEGGYLTIYGRETNINVYNEDNIYYQVDRQKRQIDNLASSITPKNFKNVIDVTDLKYGCTIIHDQKMGNYDAATRKIVFSSQSGSYIIKIDLSVIKRGKIYGSSYTPSYTGTARVFYIAGGDDDDLAIEMSSKWSTLATVGLPAWLTVDAQTGDWVIDIDVAKEKSNSIAGKAKCLYMWSETSNPQTFYFDGEAKLPAWLRHDEPIPRLVLPGDSVAVVAHEWNMYYENVTDGLTDRYYVFCTGVTGMSYERFLRFTPQASDIGDKTINVKIFDKITGKAVDEGEFALHVIADSAPQKKVIFIGDSLTDAGVYVKEIQTLSNGNIVSIGTRTATVNSVTVNHEGRSGWSVTKYTTVDSFNNMANAFWNPLTSKFDFSYYMSQNGFSDIDCVMLNLGTNDVTNIQGNISGLNEMIASIHNYDSNIKIIISLITPPATQDGCGNHTNMFDATAWKHNQLELVKRYILEYQDRDNNVYLSEPYFNIDRLYDFNTVSIPVSSRNPTTFLCQNNNVHPSTYGYLKMADVYYASLLYRLS